MGRLGVFLVRRRKLVLILALIGLIAAGVIGSGVAGRLSNGGFENPEAESFIASQVLADEFSVSPPDIIIVASAPGSVDDPAAAEAGRALSAALAAEDGIASVSSYWTLGSPPPLRSTDGTSALVFASVDGTQDEMLAISTEIAEEYRGEYSGLEVAVGGQGPVFSEVNEVIEADLVKAESIADERQEHRDDRIDQETADEDPIVVNPIELRANRSQDRIERGEDRHGRVPAELEADVDVEDETGQDAHEEPEQR